MYKVIKYFTDLQDNKQPYNPGDEFPRDGLKVSQARLDELASDKNRRGEPLIEYVQDDAETEVAEQTGTVEQPEQKEPRKRKSKEPAAEKED